MIEASYESVMKSIGKEAYKNLINLKELKYKDGDKKWWFFFQGYTKMNYYIVH